MRRPRTMTARVLPSALFSPEDQQWWSELKKGPVGRDMASFVACVNDELTGGLLTITPMQQVHMSRFAFCRELSRTATPFGVASPLPRVIVIANLNGQRVLLTSNRICLATVLALNSPAVLQPHVQGNVEAVVEFASQTKQSVLLCLSAPWNTMMQTWFWDVRTLRADGRMVIDGEMAFNPTMPKAAALAPTNANCHAYDPRLLDEFCDALSAHWSLTNLDEKEACAVGDSDVTASLRVLYQKALRENQKLCAEREAMKSAADERLEEERKKADHQCEVAIVTAKGQAARDEARIRALEQKVKELGKEVEKKNKELENERSIASECKLLYEERQEARQSAEALAVKNESLIQDQLKKLREEKKRLLAAQKKQEQSNLKLIEEADRKRMDAEVRERTAQENERTIQKIAARLEAALDALRNENKVATFEHLRFRRKTLLLRIVLAVAAKKHSELKELVASTAATLEPPARADTATSTEPLSALIHSSKEVSELTELVQQQHKELDALKAGAPKETARGEKDDSAKTPVEPSTEKTVAGGADAPRSADAVAASLTVVRDECGDGATEAVIASVASSMKNLIELARQSSYHKHNADSAYAELGVLRNIHYHHQQLHNGGYHHYNN